MLLLSYGSRPEKIKLQSVIAECNKQNLDHAVLFTGQHELLRSEGGYDYSFEIEDSTDRLNSLTAQLIFKFSAFLDEHPEISSVATVGDTTTVLALSIAAFNRGIKVIHIEAGLRCKKNGKAELYSPWPEGGNRAMVSQIAHINFCPTEDNFNNLIKEEVGGKCFITGNPGLDLLKSGGTTREKIVLISLHRRENHDKIPLFFQEINKLAIDYPGYAFILPLHPNPNVRKHRDILTHVQVVEPLPHADFTDLIRRCSLLISDSGGVIEESSFYKKPMIVLRSGTERDEALGLTAFLSPEPEDLRANFEKLINYTIVEHDCPFGDGHAAERIVEILKNEIF